MHLVCMIQRHGAGAGVHVDNRRGRVCQPLHLRHSLPGLVSGDLVWLLLASACACPLFFPTLQYACFAWEQALARTFRHACARVRIPTRMCIHVCVLARCALPYFTAYLDLPNTHLRACPDPRACLDLPNMHPRNPSLPTH